LPFGGFALQGFLAYYSRIRESLREAKPLFLYLFPLMLRIHLPIMERGIKGVRLINNLNGIRYSTNGVYAIIQGYENPGHRDLLR
jgi:hypothetical protein